MWFKKTTVSSKDGLIQALGVVGYVGLFTVFINYASKEMAGPDPWWAPMLFLTLLCFSVLVCSLIVFYRPIKLALDKRGKEALQLVISTTKWLGMIVALIVILAMLVS